MEQVHLAQEQDSTQVYRAEERIEAQETVADATLAKEVLAASRRQRRRILRGVSALLTSWLALYIFLYLFESVGLYSGWLLPEGLIAPFLGTSFLGSMALCALFSMPGRKQKERIRELARTADVNAIGPMIELLSEIQPRHTRAALRDALTELLPRLKESDSLLPLSRQRAKLHRILEDAYWYHDVHNPAFVVAILRAMGQIGDERSLKVVRQLAGMRARKESRKQIREAAAEALDLIELRIERRNSPSVLLRAADYESTDATLLRPMAESGREPAALLLRTASDEQPAT
jgi:hypothetical protein